MVKPEEPVPGDRDLVEREHVPCGVRCVADEAVILLVVGGSRVVDPDLKEVEFGVRWSRLMRKGAKGWHCTLRPHCPLSFLFDRPPSRLQPSVDRLPRLVPPAHRRRRNELARSIRIPIKRWKVKIPIRSNSPQCRWR